MNEPQKPTIHSKWGIALVFGCLLLMIGALIPANLPNRSQQFQQTSAVESPANSIANPPQDEPLQLPRSGQFQNNYAPVNPDLQDLIDSPGSARPAIPTHVGRQVAEIDQEIQQLEQEFKKAQNDFDNARDQFAQAFFSGTIKNVQIRLRDAQMRKEKLLGQQSPAVTTDLQNPFVSPNPTRPPNSTDIGAQVAEIDEEIRSLEQQVKIADNAFDDVRTRNDSTGMNYWIGTVKGLHQQLRDARMKKVKLIGSK